MKFSINVGNTKINLKNLLDNFERFHSRENIVGLPIINRKSITHLLSKFTAENQCMIEYWRINIKKKVFMLTPNRFFHGLMALQSRDIRCKSVP